MPVFSSGRPDSDEKADKQAAQLEKIADQLQLILRDLKSGSHFAQMQLNNIKKVPQEHRWSAKQAAEQKSRDLATLSADAEDLAELVRDLLRRNGLLTPIQTAKRTMDLFKDLESHLPLHTHTSTQQPSRVPMFSGSDDPSAAHVESLVPLVTLIYVAIKYWREKYKKGQDN
ncbi:MAG TPA: hypothetical protein VH325_08725 [Bryobacteraceae bacterium]|nr:hypothetical protein [Bryobacteraceae bacterium]